MIEIVKRRQMPKTIGTLELSKTHAAVLGHLFAGLSKLTKDSTHGFYAPLRFETEGLDMSTIDASNTMVAFCSVGREWFDNYDFLEERELVVDARDFEKKLGALASQMDENSLVKLTVLGAPDTITLTGDYLKVHKIKVRHQARLFHPDYYPRKPVPQEISDDYARCELTIEEFSDALQTITVAGGSDAGFVVEDESLVITTETATAGDRFTSRHAVLKAVTEGEAAGSVDVSIVSLGIAQAFMEPFDRVLLSVGGDRPLWISGKARGISVDVVIAPSVEEA